MIANFGMNAWRHQVNKFLSLKQAFSYAVENYSENPKLISDGFRKKMYRAGAISAPAVSKQGIPIQVDLEKLRAYYEKINNPLKFSNVCKQYNITSSRLTYICLLYNIPIEIYLKKRYFKNEEDKNNAVRLSRK